MAAASTSPQPQSLNRNFTTKPPPRPKLVCFSFAAYANTLIQHLKSLNIPLLPGLSDPEFKSIESSFNFIFPPDLRYILQVGLPVGAGFPNWRSFSSQQLQVLVNIPRFALLKEISEKKFWCGSWGDEPHGLNEALDLAKRLLNDAPVLVPIYTDCYIPSAPNMAGNPVFFVRGGDIRVLSFDLAGFFQRIEFFHLGDFGWSECLGRMSGIRAPVWTATVARRVEFWTDVVEQGRRRSTTRESTHGWWTGMGFGLDGCLEEVFWRLREGGWREEEVSEMMMMIDGGDEKIKSGPKVVRDYGVVWHVRLLSLALLRGGWTRKDVEYSLDLKESFTNTDLSDWDSTFDFQHQQLMHLHSLDL